MMLLIRGFNDEKYARQIERGVIGFRDLLSTLSHPQNNGYKYSDYYEEHLIKAIAFHNVKNILFENALPRIRERLQLLFDSFVPNFYLSYFHILNEHSEEWLENSFNDKSHFIWNTCNFHCNSASRCISLGFYGIFYYNKTYSNDCY